MGFELLPVETNDEDKYDIITITSPERWNPHRFTQHNSDANSYFDPSDMLTAESNLAKTKADYPAFLHHLSAHNSPIENDHSNDRPNDYDCLNDTFCMTEMTQPLIESHI